MVKLLISELTLDKLAGARSVASKDLELLIDSPYFEDVKRSKILDGDSGNVHLGVRDEHELTRRMYAVHVVYEKAPIQSTEIRKIEAYFAAAYLLSQLKPEERTIAVPTVIGHRFTQTDGEAGLGYREIYVDFIQKKLPSTEGQDATGLFAYLLGRDVARFMYMGMDNVPRHLIPKFDHRDLTTHMIDLDRRPNTFRWNPRDESQQDSLNYETALQKEYHFFRETYYHFFTNKLPDKLKVAYLSGFVEEVRRLKGDLFNIDRFIKF